ncbi:MAG: 1-deoxy-D-xylulose-5-phosphate reductoisomerase, partial [Dinghuibacter sp.]|nr:1-deoxy-D-xylulose-5-phosphate reductoisomerase [Dinghuibacter sp.]
MKKKIAVFGSTGSIGTQALEVIEQHPDLFEVDILTAHANGDLLVQQALKHQPNAVVIGEEAQYAKINDALFPHGIKVFT